METDIQRKPALRGFAAMSPERRREISAKGGAAVPNERRAFSQHPDLASIAGAKGGRHSVLRRR